METRTGGRRSVAWQLAAGAAGLTMAIGSSVLLPGLAAAAEDPDWAAPVIADATSCDSSVFLEFTPGQYLGDDEPTYWANVAAAPEAGGEELAADLVEADWRQLEVESLGGGLAARVGPLTADRNYSIVLEARAGSGEAQVDSVNSAAENVAVSDAPCTVVTPPPAEPSTSTPAEPSTSTPAEPSTSTPAEPSTSTPAEPSTSTPAEPSTSPQPQPPVEVPVEVPVTPVPDHGGTPQVPSAPIVPTTVPSTPLKLTTDQGADTQLTVGEKLTIKGEGFMPFSSVSVIVYSQPRVLTTVVADAQGRFQVEVTVPSDLPAGNHSLVASGVAPDGSEHFLRLDVTVDQAGVVAVTTTSSGEALAYTGAEPLVPALLGAGALVGGGALVLVARRRKAARG